MIVVYLVGPKPLYTINSMIMKILLFIAFLFTTLLSCKTKTAFDYSERIVKMETDLSRDIAGADEKVSKFLDAAQQDSAKIISQQMEDMAASALKKVQTLDAPNVAEAENFKKEAVKYFTYLKAVYASLNRFVMATTDETKEAERLKLARIVSQKEEATKALQLAQQKFAKANNFRVESR
jgi:hypothetical protein